MKKILLVLSLFVFQNIAFGADSFSLGVSSYKSGNFVLAERYFQAAVNQNPSNLNARYWYSQALIKNKDITTAKQQYQYIIKQSPNSTVGKYSRQGLELLNSQIKSNSSMSYQYGEDNYIKNAYRGGALYRLPPGSVKVYIQPGPYKDVAISAFNEWQDKTGRVVTFLFSQSPQYAKINVSFVEKIDKANYDGKFEAGNCHYEFSDKYVSKATVKILTVLPNGQKMSQTLMKTTLLHEIGHAIGIAGHSTNPADIMSTATNRMNYSLTARDINTAKILYRGYPKKDLVAINDSKINEAIDFAKKMPSDPNSWIDLGNAYYGAKRYKEAIPNYQKAIGLGSKDTGLFLNIVASCYNSGDLNQAYTYAKQGISINKSDSKLMGNYLLTCYKTGKHAEAKASLSAYITKNPNKRYDKNISEYVKYYQL